MIFIRVIDKFLGGTIEKYCMCKLYQYDLRNNSLCCKNVDNYMTFPYGNVIKAINNRKIIVK